MRNVLLIFLYILFLFSCSSRIERDNLSSTEYFNQINKSIANEYVTINYINNKNIDKGTLIQIDKNILLLKKSKSNIKIKTNTVRSIKYDKTSASGIILGSVLGFALGLLAISISGAKIDIAEGHNSSFGARELVLISPILGAIIGGNSINHSHIIVLQK